MTIAFGVACDDGVLLATDSITTTWQDGHPYAISYDRKEGRIGSSIAYILSGTRPAGWQSPELSTDEPLERIGTAMLADLADRVPTSVQTKDGWDLVERGSIVLIASPTELLLVGRDPSPRRGVVGGPPLVDGSIGHWAEEEHIDFGSAPTTLAAAADFTLDWCRRYIGSVMLNCVREFGAVYPAPGGGIPPAFPPYHLTYLTPSGIESVEVPI